MADLGDYISGGYFLTKLVPRPKAISDLVPDVIFTVSTCFTDTAPEEWSVEGYPYTSEERAAEAAQFGIPEDVVPQLVQLMTREVGVQHCNAFPSLAVAREFYRHCRRQSEIALVGIGLSPALLPSLYSQRQNDVNQGYGLLDRIDLGQKLSGEGEFLGYELLGYDATKFHTWLCHNIPPEAKAKFGVRPNEFGFIDGLDDALRVRDDMVATGAETAVWEPWAIVRYRV